MRILVIGSGGREHALVWKLAQSKLAEKIFCAPGNAGIAGQAENINMKPDDFGCLVSFAKREKIDLTVVGPEAPLAAGIVDEFTRNNLKIFGPSKEAARLEASKVFAKEIMRKYRVPTANFEVFDNLSKARKYIDAIGAPCVVKADGLAAGKGVVVAHTREEALNAVQQMMEERVFGDAGRTVIIEECLQGEEASILVITDSKAVIPLATSQDHKRVFDNDLGPNTGGMGAYSPAPVVGAELMEDILKRVVHRTIDGLIQEGIQYRGVLYAGIMITENGPKVLEFNVRFGDPETQVILPRLQSDLVRMMLAVSEGRLSEITFSEKISWDQRASVCVVFSSGGYPGEYSKGVEIGGLDAVAGMQDVIVFHAGTKMSVSQDQPSRARYITSGGRVLGLTGLGATIKDARNKAYEAAEKIRFQGMHYRKDIAARAIR
jgi:phosphoribosylamine--glycine ligase